MPPEVQATFQLLPASEGIPKELAEFLARDTYSLLIKGDSGTGKTILALTILKALRPIENLLYISTRTSPLQLLEDYPWVEEIFGPPGALETKGKETEGWETLVDARLDEPNVVFERITNVLMDKQAPTVVIDSWESMADTLGSEALRTNIRVLQTWRERAGARFIFVGEDPANTAIDFMVEGVLILKERVQQGRRLRELLISKLHGVPIQRPSYHFSLEEGVVTSFPRYSRGDYEFRSPLPITLDKPFRRVKDKFPTGFSALDSHLEGGYPSDSVVLIELDMEIDSRVGLVFVSRAVQDWVAAGDRVIVEKPVDVDKDFMRKFEKSFGRDAGHRLTIEDPFGRKEMPTAGEARSGRGKRGEGKTITIVSRSGDADEPPRSDFEIPRAEPTKADLSIVIERTGRNSSDKVKGALTHLRFLDIDGTLFLECMSPRSPLFGVIPSRTAGNPMIALEPVV